MRPESSRAFEEWSTSSAQPAFLPGREIQIAFGRREGALPIRCRDIESSTGRSPSMDSGLPGSWGSGYRIRGRSTERLLTRRRGGAECFEQTGAPHAFEDEIFTERLLTRRRGVF